jgi:hypothetical protein
VEQRAVREVKMDFEKLRAECVRRGWVIMDERGPDTGPDAFKIELQGSSAEASCYRSAANWRVVFHGTLTQLHELHDVLLACGAA